MGRAIDATDKLHWFLRGLGESFTQFAFTHLSLTPLPSFEEMVWKAISFEIFHSSMENRSTTQVAFYSNNRPATSSRINQQQRNTGRGNSSSSGRGGFSRYVVVVNAPIFLVFKYVASKATKLSLALSGMLLTIIKIPPTLLRHFQIHVLWTMLLIGMLIRVPLLIWRLSLLL